MTNPLATTKSGPPGAATVAPKPVKLTDEEMRLECVRLAVQAKVPPALIIDTAVRIHDFVKWSKS